MGRRLTGLAGALAFLAGCGGAVPAAPASPPSAAVGSVASAGGSGAASGKPAASQLRKAVFSRPSAAMTSFHVAVARDEGFFTRNGLDMTVSQMQTPATMAALQSGEVQFATGTGTTTRSAIQGLPVRVVGYIQTEPFSFVTKPEITSLSALKGQKVGFNSVGGDDYVYTVAALKKGGLTPSDVEALPVGSSGDIAKTLLAGQIAGGVLAPPFTQQLVEQGFKLHTGPELINLPSSGIASSVQVLKNDPALVRATVNAVLDAIAWTKSNPTEATAYFAKNYDMTPSIAKAAYEQEMASLRFSWTDDELQGAIQRALEEAKTDKKPQMSDIYDSAIFNELAKAKGLQ